MQYSGAESTFLTDAFTSMNKALDIFVTSFSSELSSEIAPIVMSGLILSFIIIGIMSIRGLINSPFQEVAWKMAYVSCVISIALIAGVYQQYVIEIFITMPDDIISSIVANSISGVQVQTGEGAAKAIEKLYDLGAYNAGLYIDQAGISLSDGVNFAPYLMALMVFLGTVMCCLVGTLWLFISKIVLALMLAVGPAFIVCLCWKPTEQFFYKWLGMVLNTVISAVFVVAIFFLFSTFFQSNLEALEITKESANFMDAGTYLFFGLVCMGVLLMIPNFATQLTGGAVGAVGTAMAGIASRATSGVTGAATGSVRGGFATKDAVGAYRSARQGGSTTYQGNRADGQKAGRFQAAREARREYNASMDSMKRGYPDYYRNNSSNTQRNS